MSGAASEAVDASAGASLNPPAAAGRGERTARGETTKRAGVSERVAQAARAGRSSTVEPVEGQGAAVEPVAPPGATGRDDRAKAETVSTPAFPAASGAIHGRKAFTEPPADPVPDGLSHLPPLVSPGRKRVRAPERTAEGEDNDFFGLVRGVQEPEVPTPAG
jgi:hypothetical protein